MSQQKRFASQVQLIHALMETKGRVMATPDNNAEVVVIKETRIGTSQSISVAVGKVSAISNRYFDVRGKVFDDTFNRFSDNSMRIESIKIASTKGAKFFCAVFPSGLIRAVDEATWTEKFVTLADLIFLLENLGNNESNSFFTP